MFLYDLGVVCEPEPFKKLINQGMIQGRSNFVYRIVGTNTYVYAGLKSQYETTEIHVDVKDGYLTVSAEKGLDKDEEDKKGRVLRQERYAGACSRSFYHRTIRSRYFTTLRNVSGTA